MIFSEREDTRNSLSPIRLGLHLVTIEVVAENAVAPKIAVF